jgi:hypothetical protein
MPMVVAAEQTITVGEPVVIEAAGPVDTFAVVFEDDGETGYFYSVDVSGDDLRILDALHIYTVVDVSDREIPSTIKLVWDTAGARAVLLVNDRAHAVFDFEARRGYCRDDYPEPPIGSDWERPEWSDLVLESSALDAGHA